MPQPSKITYAAGDIVVLRGHAKGAQYRVLGVEAGTTRPGNAIYRVLNLTHKRETTVSAADIKLVESSTSNAVADALRAAGLNVTVR